MEGEGLKEITEDARIEDRNHFEALVPRICELGGRLPDGMKEFHDLSACPSDIASEGSEQRQGHHRGAARGGTVRREGIYAPLQHHGR